MTEMGSTPIQPSELSSQRFSSITLDEMKAIAALQTRVDRKYIVTSELCNALFETIKINGQILTVKEKRSMGYQSVYFDTPDLDLYKDAAYKRRPRFKARTRFYRSTGIAMLEVKTKDGRGKTVKLRTPYDADSLYELTESGKTFIEEATKSPGSSERLIPTLTSQYQRTTIVDHNTSTRMTCDEYLICTDWENQSTTFPYCILETKSSVQPSPFDIWLWEHGFRPQRISKYCTMLAILHSDLPANKWHRVIKNYM
jgi:VTC domain.